MRSISLVVLCIALHVGSALFASSALAQKEHNVWYYGDHAGVDFNAQPPQGLVGPFRVIEGSASISDGFTGRFLFSSDGARIYNASGAVMRGLDSVWMLGDGSSTQSALIIPFPRDGNKYFVFFVDHAGYFWKNQGVRYVEVDMRGDNGLGEVVTQPKSLFAGDMTEKITAIPHANECDVWIVTHRQSTNEYLATLIDDSTVSTQPVVSQGIDVPGPLLDNGIGWLVASQQGTQLAYTAMYDGRIEIGDFDRSTGSVSNVRALPQRQLTYGLCFSPDGTKLYTAPTNDIVLQYDLTQSNIAATETAVGTVRASSIRPMPDGKLCMTTSSLKSLHVIDQPNLQGAACNVMPNVIALDPTTSSYLGLPNIPDAYIGRSMRVCIGIENPTVQIMANINTICVGDCIELEEVGAAGRNFSWRVSDGRVIQNESNPTICFTAAGNYSVELIAINSIGDTAKSRVQFTVKPTASIQLESQTVVTDTIGALVRIPVLLNQSATGVVSVEFAFDPNTLIYTGSFDASGNPIDQGSSADSGKVVLTQTLHADSVIGYMYFQLYWENASCRNINLVSTSLSSASAQCLSTTALLEVCLEEGCGTKLLSEKLRDRLIEVSVAPNPSVNVVEVSLSDDVESARIRLVDMNGRIILEEQGSLSKQSPARLDISNVPGGTYFLLVQGEQFTRSRGIVIDK